MIREGGISPFAHRSYKNIKIGAFVSGRGSLSDPVY